MSGQIKTSPNRLEWIDYTKGFAILLIVLFHFFQNYPERINIITILDRNWARVGYAAVDIFFVIAGFNASYVLASILENNPAKIDWKAWLKKRISRLYPTYWLAVIFSLIILFIFNGFKIKSLLKFILSCLGIAGYAFQDINPGFWFFTVILEAYLVTPLIFKVCQNRPKQILLLGIVVGALHKIVCMAIGTKSPLFLFLLGNNFLGSYFFQLCLGIYWGLTYAKNRGFRKSDITISTGIFLAGITVYAAMTIAKIDIIYMLGFDMLFTPFFVLALSLFFDRLKNLKLLKPGLLSLSLMGIYSYQIYLLHQPIFIALLHYITKYFHVNPYVKILVVVPTITIIILGYVKLFIITEKFLRSKFQKTAIELK